MVFRILKFIYHCHGVVLHGDVALSVFVYDKVVFSQAEFPGTLARFQCAGRREENPVDVFLVHQRVQIKFAE